VAELCELLDSSESTVRRDLNELHKQGMLNKVFGGATVIDGAYHAEDPAVIREEAYIEEKSAIAKRAAQLVQENDFVYIDAGSTTAMVVEYLTVRRATFVTNGLPAARQLAQRGYTVSVIAGQVRATAGAIVGAEAMGCLVRYHFNIGFFGANGVSPTQGYTNTDLNESRTKSEAMSQCKARYVLADDRKFGKVLPVTFAQLSDAPIITNRPPEALYRQRVEIILADH
jgi:DeoR family fructose operon transcriptional repressor